jgi:hypothetical protein
MLKRLLFALALAAFGVNLQAEEAVVAVEATEAEAREADKMVAEIEANMATVEEEAAVSVDTANVPAPAVQ